MSVAIIAPQSMLLTFRHWVIEAKLRENSTLRLMISLALFFSGGLIYILFRSDSLAMFRWFINIGIAPYINTIRELTIPLKSDIPSWIIYTFPDGAWVIGGVSSLIYLGFKRSNILAIFFALMLGLMAIMSEILQFFGIIAGTFSIEDLAFEMVSFIGTFWLMTEWKFGGGALCYEQRLNR